MDKGEGLSARSASFKRTTAQVLRRLAARLHQRAGHAVRTGPPCAHRGRPRQPTEQGAARACYPDERLAAVRWRQRRAPR